MDSGTSKELPMTSLNHAQKRAILLGLLDIDRRLAELEAMLAYNPTSSPFCHYVNDLSTGQLQLLPEFFARLRATMLAGLKKCGISLDIPKTSLRWIIHVQLLSLQVAVADLGPGKLKGYGSLNPTGKAQVVELQQELLRLIEGANAQFQGVNQE
jgi:hypothetical protein